jgi:transposase
MPRPYPPEFRQRAIALVLDGRQIKQTATDLGIHEVTLQSWLRQDDIDHGRRPGNTSAESAELRAGRQRIRQLEQELAIVKRA